MPDRANHDWLRARLNTRTRDADVLRLIYRILKAGVVVDGQFAATPTGVPPGGPLAPRLTNGVRDERDWLHGRPQRQKAVSGRPGPRQAARTGAGTYPRTRGNRIDVIVAGLRERRWGWKAPIWPSHS